MSVLDSVERTRDACGADCADVHIDHGRAKIRVSQQCLDCADIFAIFEQMRPVHAAARQAFRARDLGAYREFFTDDLRYVQPDGFPRRALSAVLEWYNWHQDELSQNWELARQEQPLNRIAPLE